MHDLQLIGVHDDGEHLVLGDGEGQRYLLGVDEALRAAVRRDRAALGQLQIEIGGGLRPREVQARIRAGATAEQIAAASGWPIEKVRRYEGPVLAEREHVAAQARDVRLRRSGSGQVTLGAEVGRRLAGRGVDPDVVTWDSWRTDDGPWTVVVRFTAGGRERQARWHLDLGARAVTPADDEARWLSEPAPDAEGPLGSARLAAVPDGPRAASVYDIEADGGVDGGLAGHDVHGGPLDLMTAMRSRRRERDQRPARRAPGTVSPTDVPGATHPARRRRTPAPEPLELDPTLLADPPAAHPPASQVSHLLEASDADLEPITARRWPLAGLMQDEVAVADEPPADLPDGPLDPGDVELQHAVDDGAFAQAADAPDAGEGAEAAETGRHRGRTAKSRRASVPSWDDIMFGAKRD